MITANTTAPVADENADDLDEFDEDAEELEGFGLTSDEEDGGQSDLVDSSDDSYWNAQE